MQGRNCFNPDLLVIAREAAELTQAELAEKTNYAQNTISRWEAGLRVPSDEEVETIAAVLDRPVNLFYRTERPLTADVSLMFHRAKARTRVGIIRLLHAKLNISRIAIASMLRQLTAWEVHIKQFSIDEHSSPTEIARKVRTQWQVTNGPIRNLTELIEAAGAIVVRFDFGTTDVDAIGMKSWDTVPLFFVNSTAPEDRIRFSLAHELGHLVMHDLPSDSMESEADEFAAEFLVPADCARTELRGITANSAWRLKQRWRVSGQCLIRRAKDVGIIDDGRYSSLMAYFSKQGWRKVEPIQIEGEYPSTLQAILNSFRIDLEYSQDEILELTGISKNELTTIFGQRDVSPKLSVFDGTRKPR